MVPVEWCRLKLLILLVFTLTLTHSKNCDYVDRILVCIDCSIEEYITSRNLHADDIVEHIFLRNCNVTTITSDLFLPWNTTLRNLYVDNNRLEIILDENAFSDLEELEKIVLSNSKVRHIKPFVFYNLQKLTFLQIDGNNLLYLSKNSFSNLDRLNELILENNEVKILDVKTFRGLSNLHRLKLGINQIHELKGNVFKDLINLEILHLELNEIRFLDSNIFKGLVNLVELYLFDNEISHIPDNLFYNLHKLRILDISNNKILTINFKNIIRTTPSLHELIITDIPCATLSDKILNYILNEYQIKHRKVKLNYSDEIYSLTELYSIHSNKTIIVSRLPEEITPINLRLNDIRCKPSYNLDMLNYYDGDVLDKITTKILSESANRLLASVKDLERVASFMRMRYRFASSLKVIDSVLQNLSSASFDLLRSGYYIEDGFQI